MPSPEILPEDFATFVRVLMALRDLTQGELAAATELSPTTVGNYRQGKSTPPRIRPVAERLARALKVPDYVVDLYLLPGIAADRESQGGELADAVEPILQRLRDELRGLVHLMLPFGEGKDGDQPERSWPPAEAARNEALGLWARLEDCAEAERWSLVERWRELQHPGLAELLCHLSEEAASDRADQALALAKLARRVAELVPGDSAEKTGLVGCTGLCLANAVRVSGELLLARERFEEGHTSWKAGAGSTFLAEWRVLDLEASLLRDERQFGFALDQLERALAIAPVEFSGRILLNRAFTFEQMGDGEQALAELRKAEPLIDRAREPRLFLVLRFNTATALCLLDQFEEAERMVPKIQGLAAGLQKDLDNVRLKWLAGRIAAGRGRLAEADAALDEVRQEFTRNPSPWDCSLVTLELATVRLRQGRTAEVRHLAGELVWVFKAQGIHQEALAALALFREAAARDLATADFTERLVRYLRKAQGNPGLQFLA